MKLSVIVPTYNEPFERIARTLVSIFLTEPTAEVVVVDDGSDETPGAPLSSLTPPDFAHDVKIVRLDPNKGPAAAMNAGIARASGDLIARLDVGDEWFPDEKIEQLAVATKHPATFSRSRDAVEGIDRKVSPRWPSRIYRDNQFQASTVTFHRAVWERCPFDESLRWGDDWAFALDVQFHVGWHFHNAVTGTANAWPGGHSTRSGVERDANLSAVSKRAIRLSALDRAARAPRDKATGKEGAQKRLQAATYDTPTKGAK
jgi:glycosyltransferase involved in cell wall biosynthesis